MSKPQESLISAPLLARSAVWNLGGLAAPIIVGVFAIPLLLAGFGKERFGILAIIWMGVGYFSLFDMGLGRALTKLVAERIEDRRREDLAELVWTALLIILILGVAGAVAVFFGAEILIERVLAVEPGLRSEAISAFRVLALGIPVVVVTTALVGILQAHQRFATITAVRVPLGVLTFAGPLFTLQFTPSLIWATTFLLGARTLALATYAIVMTASCTEIKHPAHPAKRHIGPLFRFGGWLTVTNVVGPVMIYFDRFLIGTAMSMTAVAHYVTPYEVLSRIQIIPQSLMAVLFPAMATTIAVARPRLAALYRRATQMLLLLVLPLTSAFFLMAPELLELWLGKEFREASTQVVHWLALGWLVNALGRPAFTMLQSSGRPDLVAKVHIVELLPYILLLWISTGTHGITGTAFAWFARVLLDTVVLSELARRQFPELRKPVGQTYIMILLVLVGHTIAWHANSLIARATILLGVSSASGALCWSLFMTLRRTRSAQ